MRCLSRRRRAAARWVVSVLVVLASSRSSNAALSFGKPERLTQEPGVDAKPSLSADGKHAVFVSARTGTKNLWLLDLQTRETRSLTSLKEPGEFCDDPCLSPEGTMVVFASNRGPTAAAELWTVQVASGEWKQLTFNDNIDWMPCWSPDGQQIAFVSDRSGEDSLWVMRADGTNSRLLVTGAWDPAWSPDGKRIAYQSIRAGQEGIWAVDVNDGKPSKVSPLGTNPAWSPDGTKLCVVYRDNGHDKLAVLSVEGTQLQVLDDLGQRLASPCWGPEGESILYDAEVDGNRDLYLISLRRELPEAKILSPIEGTVAEGIVEVRGQVSAAGGALQSAALELGKGESPKEWTTLVTPLETPKEGALLAKWDTTGLTGTYTLRLTVTDRQGDSAQDSVTVRLKSEYGVEWLLQRTPSPIVASSEHKVPLKLGNSGTMSWLQSGANAVFVSYRWLDGRGKVVVKQGLRTPIPHTVNLGESVEVKAEMRAPQAPGEYILQWDLMQGDKLWFSEKQAATSSQAVTVVVPLAVEFVGEKTPRRMTPGQQYTVDVELRNTGATKWTKDGPSKVWVGYHWLDQRENPLDEVPLLTPLSEDVESGKPVKVAARVRAPAVAGLYVLRLDLQAGQDLWFSQAGASTLDIPVNVVTLHGIEVLSHSVPNAMIPGEDYVVSIRIRNSGSVTWSPEGVNAVQLGYRWVDETGKESPTRGPLAELPFEVACGQIAVASAHVQAPATPGTYRLQFDLVQGGEQWLSTGTNPPLQVTVIVARPSYAPRYSAKDHPQTMVVGQPYAVTITIANRGVLTWQPQGRYPVKLGYHWVDAFGNDVATESILTPLPKAVPLGEEVTLEAQARAPDVPGSFTIKWDLRQERQGWFSGMGAETLNVPVTVKALYAAVFETHDTPTAMVPGQRYTAHLRILNRGALKWEANGAVPVQLTYKWLDAEGTPVVTKGLLSSLPKDVPEGQAVDVTATVQAPEKPGTYTIRWDLLHGDLVWFAERGSQVLETKVEVK